MLASHPEIAGAGLYTALVLGDLERVERTLTEIPGAVRAKGGPREWEPLLYVCFSRFANGESSRASNLVATARMLLRHGADPDASYIPEQWPDNPLSCLYGATGLNNNPELALALIEAGASPNDSESLYHSTEHADLACLKLLLQRGASPAATNALKHMLDREDVQGLQLSLAAGASPNEVNERGETALHWAVWRGRSVRTLAVLLDSGVAMDTRRNDGRTAYALAVQSGQMEAAALLEGRGATTGLSALDRFVGACATADAKELDRLLVELPEVTTSPGSERLLPDLTMSHRTSAVRALLAAGMPVDARGDMGGTALHWACWKGYADIVEALIDHGASFTIEDDQFKAPPMGWFDHGVENCPERGGDYPQVARLLLAAGAKLQARDTPTGNADVDALLREHGLME
jgi:ankyrin repeat protein